MQTNSVANHVFILIILTNITADSNKIFILIYFPFNVHPERILAICKRILEIHRHPKWRRKWEDMGLLKYICVGSPTPLRWMTFYPRAVFFLSSMPAEEIPQEFVNHFRGGFLHDVSQRARPFPSSSTPRTVPVELGRRRLESRPSVFTIWNFYTSRPTRGDSSRFLRIREFENSSVRDGRFASLFSLLAKIDDYTCTRSKKNRIITTLWLAALRVASYDVQWIILYIFFK